MCIYGTKVLHKQVMESKALAKAFPVQDHSRSYVESWVDELQYVSIPDVSRKQCVHLHNAGAMMNGRIYSVDVYPCKAKPIPLREILTKDPGDEHFYLRERDMPSRTILTPESQAGQTSHVVQDLTAGQLRVLTPVECERLNGFPDGWTNTDMPERMRYFCMGNALVVPLVTKVGEVLAQATETKSNE